LADDQVDSSGAEASGAAASGAAWHTGCGAGTEHGCGTGCGTLTTYGLFV
jgi:hypothetical protein